jgi:hypothetical protein
MTPTTHRLLFATLLLTAACGDKSPTYEVGGHKLTVKDSGYTTADYYCAAAAKGQLKLNIVDYDPICGGMIPANADGGARDPQMEHNELELVYIISSHDNTKLPYEVDGNPDCTVGPAGPGIAYFKHYPSGSTTPDITVAQGGSMFLTTYDPTDMQPAVGSFDLDFGAAGKVAGDFTTYTCN